MRIEMCGRRQSCKIQFFVTLKTAPWPPSLILALPMNTLPHRFATRFCARLHLPYLTPTYYFPTLTRVCIPTPTLHLTPTVFSPTLNRVCIPTPTPTSYLLEARPTMSPHTTHHPTCQTPTLQTPLPHTCNTKFGLFLCPVIPALHFA